MKFELTEAEVIRLTGYSRQQLQRLRNGSRQVQGGKVYEANPVLTENQDWKRYGNGMILYAPHVTQNLQARKEKVTV